MSRVTLILDDSIYTLDTSDEAVADIEARRVARVRAIQNAPKLTETLAALCSPDLANLVVGYASEEYWPRDDLTARDVNQAPAYQRWLLPSALERKHACIIWEEVGELYRASSGTFSPQHQDIRPLSRNGTLLDCWNEVLSIRTPLWTRVWSQQRMNAGTQVILLTLFGAAMVRHPQVVLPIVIPMLSEESGNWIDALTRDPEYFAPLQHALWQRLYGSFCPCWWISYYSPVRGSRSAFDESGSFVYLHDTQLTALPDDLHKELPTLARKCFLLGQLLDVFLHHRQSTLVEWIASEPYFAEQRAKFLRERNVVTVEWEPVTS